MSDIIRTNERIVRTYKDVMNKMEKNRVEDLFGGPFILPFLEEGGVPMAGRKPKPTALKKLEGNPGKRKLNTKEPVPAKGMPDCPKWLLPEAKEEWKRLCKKLSEMDVLTLTEIDMAAFAAYCQSQSYARMYLLRQQVLLPWLSVISRITGSPIVPEEPYGDDENGGGLRFRYK